MEILLWLVPAAVATLLAMAWVSWWGREGRGEVEPDVAAARLAAALERDHHLRYAPLRPPPEQQHTGVAVRRTRRAS